MTNEEKEYVNKFILDALTVSSDEIEGPLVIDLSLLNLCSSDLDFSYTQEGEMDPEILFNDFINDKDIKKILETEPEDIADLVPELHTDRKIIIEFALATVQDPNPVTYKITVNPGQVINNDTIIGYVELNGKMKEIRSIWERATVKSINDDKDFYHVYPDTCNRHIVLEDFLAGNGTTIDVSALEDLNYTFQDEGYLFQLITNNLPHSMLPYILSHRIRGIFSRPKKISALGLPIYGKWELSDNDLEMDKLVDPSITYNYILDKNFKNNKRIDHPYIVFDEDNDNANNGLIIYDSSIMGVVNELLDLFGTDMLGSDITKAEMKSWKKRAKKKKNRKKVKKEINDKVEKSTDKFKVDNPMSVLEEEKNRLLKGRSDYIDLIIALYESRDTLPLCKYDSEYKDCKFLVNDTIDKNVLKDTLKFDDDFSYSAIGDTENYFNYYISLLSNINISNEDDKYSQEYFELITDIINKRLIVEKCDVKTLLRNFCDLYNENVTELFSFYKNDKQNTAYKMNSEFNKLKQKISLYSSDNSYSELTPYMQTFNYIKSLLPVDEDIDENDTVVASLLATMYTYILSYGNGDGNKYKDIKTDKDKYLYFNLVIEESNKLCEFWDKIIDLYRKNNMDNCIDYLYNIAFSFDNVATWPEMGEIKIGDTYYNHYLFENMYDRDFPSEDDDIVIGDYGFPEMIDFPEIPDKIDVDLQWAIDLLNNYDMVDFDNPNVINIKHPKYWKKYFALATLISLPPCFWNCGLDIIPFIMMIPLPCIFIAITSVYIRLFGMIMVFGIAIRGMYPWPVILYVNTTNQPISILTPLLVVVQQIKDMLNAKLNQIEEISCKGIIKALIYQLELDSNNIKKENKQLDAFIQVCKSAPFPKAESIRQTFDYIADPTIDNRQRILRLETIQNRSRAK